MKLKKIWKNKILIDGNWINVGGKKIRLYNFIEEKEYEEKDLKEILYDICLEKAYFFIAKKEISSVELRMKLLNYFVYEEIVEKVIEHLKKNSYLNDFEYIKNYIFTKKLGKKRVFYDMISLGLDEELLMKVYLEIDLDETDFIKRHMKKIGRKAFEQKISYLIRRGFSIEDIKESLGEKDEDKRIK